MNATKSGMKPAEDESLIKDVSVFQPDFVVADAVYNPRETKLIREAKAAGCKIALGGIGMLLWQGEAAFRIFTDPAGEGDDPRRSLRVAGKHRWQESQ